MLKAVLVLVLLAVGCQSQGIISCSGFGSVFTLQSVVVNGFNTDTTSLVLETQSPGMSMTLQYAGTGFGSVDAFQGAVAFDRVIEFKDTGAPGYDGETIVKETQLDFTFSPPSSCASAATVMNFTATNPSDLKTWFTLQCYVVKAKRAIGDVEIVPTQTKCDVIIENYPYNSTENRLALGGSYWYQSVSLFTGTDLLIGLNGLSVAVADGQQSIAFNWVTTAQTLGGDIDVIFTQPTLSGGVQIGVDYDRSESMFFTFGEAGSSYINWDPSFGLVEGSGVEPVAAPGKASNTNTVVASALTVASVALVALF
jgi:hypothetical protein